MNEAVRVITGIFLLLLIALGGANIIILPFGIRGARLMHSKILIGGLYLIMAVICYFLARSGFVSDARQIGGDQVAPFYGTEWYFLAIFGSISLAYQFYLIKRSGR